MPGNKIGGLKAAKTNKAKWGEDFYARIGREGGKNGKGPGYTGGFASNSELASRAGRLGGMASHRKAPNLSPSKVAYIRNSKDDKTAEEMAELFGVSKRTVLNIWRGKIYVA